MKLPPIILASASPRRAELLHGMGVRFKFITAPAEEIHDDQLTATELCQVNAFRKARAVATAHPSSLVLGADTLVTLDGELFGKPRDLTDAARMLRKLAGRTHQVVTGVCLIHLRTRRCRIFFERTDVKFKRLSAAAIRRYHAQVNPLDKAGAYGIQEHGDLIVQSIRGSLTNVIGLPVERLRAELAAW
ncbi:MAG: septum formation protein Maf [Verrucomicrobia bacterium]|nr:septum formation protein Maf [Verrucomicrobiota bacterium]